MIRALLCALVGAVFFDLLHFYGIGMVWFLAAAYSLALDLEERHLP
jgi:hypothetical protein